MCLIFFVGLLQIDVFDASSSGLTCVFFRLLVDDNCLLASFHPAVTDVGQRLFLSYAQEVGRVDRNNDGVISFVEADVDGTSDGLPNTRLYLSPRAFNRWALTREINHGLLAPRFAPFQRAYVLSGSLALVNPSVPASPPRDADDR